MKTEIEKVIREAWYGSMNHEEFIRVCVDDIMALLEPKTMKHLPSKLKDPAQTKHKRLYDTVNQLIDFMGYFVRETEKCCSCNGCARHPKV